MQGLSPMRKQSFLSSLPADPSPRLAPLLLLCHCFRLPQVKSHPVLARQTQTDGEH